MSAETTPKDSAACASDPPAPEQPQKPEEKTGEKAKGSETNVKSLSSQLAASTMLDMVFVMDATGSMGSYIASAQQTIKDIVQEIVVTEKADVRFALISYRDHPPQDSTYVINEYPFTSSVKTMRENLDKLTANGGGDGPEAVVDGLHAATKLDYRDNATKVCTLIADAPPHGLGMSGDGFPDGCPCGLDPITVCRNMAEKGISLYCIGCEPSISPYKSFFMALAAITGGQYCPMQNSKVLATAVVSTVREEICLEGLMDEVRHRVDASEGMTEEEQARLVQQALKEKGVRSKQTKADVGMPTMTEDAVSMSKAGSLAEARKHFKTSSSATSGSYSAKKKESAAPPAPPASKGFFSSLRSTFSSRERPADVTYPISAPDDSECMTSAGPTEYSVVEDEVSYEQASRLVSKSRARSHY